MKRARRNIQHSNRKGMAEREGSPSGQTLKDEDRFTAATLRSPVGPAEPLANFLYVNSNSIQQVGENLPNTKKLSGQAHP